MVSFFCANFGSYIVEICLFPYWKLLIFLQVGFVFYVIEIEANKKANNSLLSSERGVGGGSFLVTSKLTNCVSMSRERGRGLCRVRFK